MHSLRKDYKEVFPFYPYTEAPEIVGQVTNESTPSDHVTTILISDSDGYFTLLYCTVYCVMGQAADYMNITDKRVLVIGTETPWLEAVLLQRNPRCRIFVLQGPPKLSM